MVYRAGSPAKASPPGAGPKVRACPGHRGAGAGATPAAPSPRARHVGLEGAEADHDTLHRPQHDTDLGRHLLPAPYYSSQRPPRGGGKWRRACRPPRRRLGNAVRARRAPHGSPGDGGPLCSWWDAGRVLPASFSNPRRWGPGSFMVVEGGGPTDQPVPAPPLTL